MTTDVTEGLKFFFWGRISRVHVGQDRACVDLFVFNDTIYLSRCDGGTMLEEEEEEIYSDLFVFNDTIYSYSTILWRKKDRELTEGCG